MPYTGNPSSNAADAVRVMVGDTDPTAPKLDDDSYTFIIANESRIHGRAAMAASMLAGKYAAEMNKKIGEMWREAKVLYEHFRDLAAWFRQETARRAAPIAFAGGVNVVDVENRKQDNASVQPEFTVGKIDSYLLDSLAEEGQ